MSDLKNITKHMTEDQRHVFETRLAIYGIPVGEEHKHPWHVENARLEALGREQTEYERVMSYTKFLIDGFQKKKERE